MQAKLAQPRKGATSKAARAQAACAEVTKKAVMWQVEADEGWVAYSPEICEKLTEAAGRKDGKVEFTLGEHEYCVSFCGADEAKQTNLATRTVRAVQKASAVPEDHWDEKLSHSALSIVDAAVTAQSGRDGLWSHNTRAAFGKNVYEFGGSRRGWHKISIVYNHGDPAYLCVGLCKLCEDFQDEDGHPLKEWSRRTGDSVHASCWLFSYCYTAFSADGSEWTSFPGERHIYWKSGDVLVVELNLSHGLIGFAFRERGSSVLQPLGIAAEGLTGRFRVCALLGGEEQSLSFCMRAGTLPPWIAKTALCNRRQSRALQAVLSDTAMRGISLQQILELAEIIRDSLSRHAIHDGSRSRLTWDTINMYHVNEHFVIPMTAAAKCSYVQFVAGGCQAPQWMISHAWSTPFSSTVRMLQLHATSRHRERPLDTLYWCCTMANNQHNLAELSEEDIMQSPFGRVLQSDSCMGTILLCDTAVTPMKRVWCVFEVHVTDSLRSGRLGSKTAHFLDVAASVSCEDGSGASATAILEDAMDGNWHELADTPGVYFPLEVARVGTQVDIAQAQASVIKDRNAILNHVCSGKPLQTDPPASHPQYEALNAFIHSIFASAELYRLACERPEGCLDTMANLLSMRVDPNKFVRNGNTALFAVVGADPATRVPASARDLQPMLELLLEARADPNCVNAENCTVLDHSGAIPESAQALLKAHGARTFLQVAPRLEEESNKDLQKLVSRIFASESEAFGGSGGGGSGAKLLRKAEQGLQEVAAILKRHPKASYCIETRATKQDKHKKRGIVLKSFFASAGCSNHFDIASSDRGPLVRISLSFSRIDGETPGNTSPSASSPKSKQGR